MKEPAECPVCRCRPVKGIADAVRANVCLCECHVRERALAAKLVPIRAFSYLITTAAEAQAEGHIRPGTEFDPVSDFDVPSLDSPLLVLFEDGCSTEWIAHQEPDGQWLVWEDRTDHHVATAQEAARKLCEVYLAWS